MIIKAILVTLYGNLLTFPDTDKKFELVDFFERITNKNYIVDLADLLDKKFLFDYAKEINSDEKTSGNKITRGKNLIGLP